MIPMLMMVRLPLRIVSEPLRFRHDGLRVLVSMADEVVTIFRLRLRRGTRARSGWAKRFQSQEESVL